MSGVLVDTCIVIDALRKKYEAIQYLKSISDSLFVSVLTCAELRSGAKDSKEKVLIDAILANTQIIPLTESIANQGGDLHKQYRNSHGVGLVDAIIASTALSKNMPVITLNKKHFPMVEVIRPY